MIWRALPCYTATYYRGDADSLTVIPDPTSTRYPMLAMGRDQIVRSASAFDFVEACIWFVSVPLTSDETIVQSSPFVLFSC